MTRTRTRLTPGHSGPRPGAKKEKLILSMSDFTAGLRAIRYLARETKDNKQQKQAYRTFKAMMKSPQPDKGKVTLTLTNIQACLLRFAMENYL